MKTSDKQQIGYIALNHATNEKARKQKRKEETPVMQSLSPSKSIIPLDLLCVSLLLLWRTFQNQAS